ncbi:MAG: topoisomerase DNA-binding C4 zinc finger domain-containing protein [Rhodobacteraceae bacterium]|nr:topoisomerase DNA-binding C4 zinc finger domain-containing protein [Paracoccaceae bacterium]
MIIARFTDVSILSFAATSYQLVRTAGVGFPVRDDARRSAKCVCDKSYLAYPECSDGWLVERKGRFGKFLSCVKFPRCAGKAKA